MLLVAHRTPRTRVACEAFVAAGAGMFECDVQLRGATVFVSHYLPFLGRRGWLEHDNATFRWRQGVLRRDLTLAQTVALIPAECGILLDPKERDARRRGELADAVARELPERDRFLVSTDRLDDLARYRAGGFATWRTVKNASQLADALATPAPVDSGVSVRHTLLDRGTIEALQAVAGTVVAWTVNDERRATELRDSGVDGITTDELRVMRGVAPE